jgi:H+/Cl- antiporter ClcA
VYLYLLYELDYLKQGTWHSVAAILGITFVSLAASEAMATYFFPEAYRYYVGDIDRHSEFWANMPWILLNLALLLWLSWKARQARKARSTTTNATMKI